MSASSGYTGTELHLLDERFPPEPGKTLHDYLKRKDNRSTSAGSNQAKGASP